MLCSFAKGTYYVFSKNVHKDDQLCAGKSEPEHTAGGYSKALRETKEPDAFPCTRLSIIIDEKMLLLLCTGEGK